MGVISRKIFPACESMCICCPALRSRSRQPVKRYKKLLSDIFPKSTDAAPSERRIVKLCEYAAKNPFRIPNIAKYLEERCYKELRSENIKFVAIVAEAYNKLLCMCNKQMACFAVHLLNVVVELLDNCKCDAVPVIGCQSLTMFIFSQADGTFMYNIENLVHKVCTLAREAGEEDKKRSLRASSLQCLSAMVWFMAEFSHIFVDFEEIVHVTLDNYERDTHNEEDDERGEGHHNWVDEVVRCEGRGGVVGSEISPNCAIVRPQPEKKDPSILTREEAETPEVWAQICIQRMVELARESTTMRRVLDPMFVYFDNGRHWVPRHGLAMIVLSDMSYFVASPGDQQLILAAVVRHLDHKNVSHDPQIKSHVLQTASALARQIRYGTVLSEIGFVSDLCRHLRKIIQATGESVEQQELNRNSILQNSIEDCLLETAKGIADPRPLFDMMARTLEKLPSVKVVARATIRSLIILAHMISLAYLSSHSQQVFPEALLFQLLKVMLHPDVEVRVGVHQIFSVLLISCSSYSRHDTSYHTMRWKSNTTSAFASIAALLEKLRREKDGTKAEKDGIHVQDDFKEGENSEEEWKQGRTHKNSPNFQKIGSIIDRKAGSTGLAETEPSSIMKFSEDQVAQLLSAFWIQANLPDNLPSNVEAIAHSFCLTLLSSRLKNPNDTLVIRFFQLPLSLRKLSLDPNHGTLHPAYQRSLLVLSTSMLMFAAKIFQIPDLNDLLEQIFNCDVDPYLGIGDDFQVYAKHQVDVGEYNSTTDNQAAVSLLCELQNRICESDMIILEILVQNLLSITELEADELVKHLSEAFTPDDALMFGPQSMLEFDHVQASAHSKESSFDVDFPSTSFEDDVTSDTSVADLSRFMPKIPTSPSPSISHIVSIGQLLESALEVAGQVAGTSVSTSPLPYSTMASQCEALGTDTRKKLSSWLTHENHYSKAADRLFPAFHEDGRSTIRKITSEGAAASIKGALLPRDPWLALRLPPASPFDNFLRAARG